MSTRETLVIVGAGLAGATTAIALRDEGFAGRVVLVGAETEPPYQRPPLSKDVLHDPDVSFDAVQIESLERFAALDIQLLLGEEAHRLRPDDGEVELRSGACLAFDDLVVASGASPRELHIPGAELGGVTVLRTWSHAVALAAAIERSGRLAVLGGGLIGLEVAAAVRARGGEATLIEAGPRVLGRSVGALAAGRVTTLLRDHGVAVELGVGAAELVGADRVEGLVLTDGRRIEADHVLVAIGVEPTVAWLAGSGIELAGGVVIDGSGRTSVRHVLAAGDVACTVDPRSGRLVRTESFARTVWQARAAARSIVGLPVDVEPPFGTSTELFGVRIQSNGDTSSDDVIVRGDVASQAFSVFHLADGVVRGATVVGRPRDWPLARRLVTDAASAVALRDV